jgi:hypothetical protein
MERQTRFSHYRNLPCCLVPLELFDLFENRAKQCISFKFAIPAYNLESREHYRLALEYPANQLKQHIRATENRITHLQGCLDFNVNTQTKLDRVIETHLLCFFQSREKVFIDSPNYISVYFAIKKVLIELDAAHLFHTLGILRLNMNTELDHL